MDQIALYLKDPAWWFSAFFIAIVASVIAGFAKDRIEQWFSHISTKARQIQAQRMEARERMISALAENEGFLTIAMIRTVGHLIISLCFIIIFLLSPMVAELVTTWCVAVPADPTCGHGMSRKALSLFFAIGFGTMSVVVNFRASSYSRTTMRAYRRYRQKHGFPAIK